MRVFPLRPPSIWLLLVLFCIGLVVGSHLLTTAYTLQPCYLCIFQRLLYLLLVPLFLLSVLLWPRPAARHIGLLALLTAAGGLATALYQSWLQWQPPGSVSCVAGQPNLIEGLVEWLGQRMPELFLATGFCEDAQLVILGLSLAHWSALGFAACLSLGYLAWRQRPERRIFQH